MMLLDFVRDDRSEESVERVIMAVLWPVGMGVVVRRRLREKRGGRIRFAGELCFETRLVFSKLRAELLRFLAFSGRERGDLLGRELASFEKFLCASERLRETVHVREFGSFGRFLLEIARVGDVVCLLGVRMKNGSRGGADFFLAEDSSFLGVSSVEFGDGVVELRFRHMFKGFEDPPNVADTWLNDVEKGG